MVKKNFKIAFKIKNSRSIGMKKIAAFIRDSKNKEIPSIQAFWFAWFTFHPKTTLYQVK